MNSGPRRLDLVEFIDNPESRCPVALVLDTSTSMSGAPLAELNAGLAALWQDIKRDELAALRVELAVVTFGGRVDVVQDFATVDQFDPPVLRTAGDTPLGAALALGLDLIENRKAAYRRSGTTYYRPWMFLITDGAPTDGDRWELAARMIQMAEEQRKLSFFAVGVAGANIDMLGRIASPSRPPLMLRSLRFRELFEWLSVSLRRVSTGRVGGDMVKLPPVDGWAMTST
jgi:uncharacterized protein YegL